MKKILKESVIKIKDIAYLRDLGGIPTMDNLHIKYGLIFRSSHLGYIDDASKERLATDLKISKVIDFRSPSELLDKPEQLIVGTEYKHLQILDDKDNPAVNRKTRNEVLKNNMAEEGGTKGHLVKIYRKLVSLPSAIKEYRSFFLELLNSNEKPVMYHCTQGKDRTGIASALILLALGVDKDIIIEDYLYYNKVNRKKNFLYTFGVAVAFFSIKKATQLKYLLVATKDYIKAAFEEIDALGGIKNYLSNYLGLSNENIDKLKQMYLE